mmetsp:Transcript_16688/g.26654  ORF Transcript_16688/g.26654 Transcript_16688/m.26654 type:complete len:314 (+) Transcript_16688:221-1162(+)
MRATNWQYYYYYYYYGMPVVLAVVYERRGTPRQGSGVPSGIGRLELIGAVQPQDSLDGLQHYSHLWVIWVFHENTNLAKVQSISSSSSSLPSTSGSSRKNKKSSMKRRAGPRFRMKAKVRPPRLDGKACGLFSTRTPHRPNPIGLTSVRIESIKGRSVFVSGLDMIDGTPILDVKPYIPLYDSIPRARIPDWITSSTTFRKVIISDDVIKELKAAEPSFKHYSSCEQFIKALSQILRNDIRSHFQRCLKKTKPQLPKARPVGNCGAKSSGNSCNLNAIKRQYEVRMDVIRVLYEIDDENNQVKVISFGIIPST